MSSYNNNDADEITDLIFGFLFFIVVVGSIIAGIFEQRQEKKTEKELGKETYEVVITDKYDCLGSEWHLIGGRATETEYHLVYKYRCINRPKDEHKSSWKSRDNDVSHSTWAKYKIGDSFTTQTDPYFYIY